jgi:hypothetical protein
MRVIVDRRRRDDPVCISAIAFVVCAYEVTKISFSCRKSDRIEKADLLHLFDQRECPSEELHLTSTITSVCTLVPLDLSASLPDRNIRETRGCQ